MRPLWPSAIIIMAGCLAPPASLETDAAPGDAAPQEVAVTYDGTGCTTVAVLPWVEPEDTYSLLPPGFWPADASTVLHGSASTGKTLVLVSWTTCRTWGEDGPRAAGNVAILVEAPSVGGVPKQAGWDFYEVVRITDDPTMKEILAGRGWPTVPGTAALGLDQAIGPASHVRLQLEVEGEPAFDARSVGAAEYSIEAKAIRLWNNNGDGLAVHTFEATAAGAAGAATCRVPEGSPLAPFLSPITDGEGSCQAPVNAVTFRDVAWQTRFHFLAPEGAQ